MKNTHFHGYFMQKDESETEILIWLLLDGIVSQTVFKRLCALKALSRSVERDYARSTAETKQ